MFIQYDEEYNCWGIYKLVQKGNKIKAECLAVEWTKKKALQKMHELQELYNMRAKQVYLTEEERMIMQTVLSLEIQANEASLSFNIEPAFKTKTLKNLYEKIAGHEWGR